MDNICPIEKCTGCQACYNTCKHGAIKMMPDGCGFIYPMIDNDECINCGLCKRSCPVNEKTLLLYPQSCYAATLKSDADLYASASGGAATAFMRTVISDGGVVYGCTGEDVYNVHHVRIDSLSDIDRLRGSKYVQSQIGDAYIKVKKDLKEEKPVLFIGTPCQIAGLQAFLRKDYTNLITVDLVCHGVPSQKMLNENIHYYTTDADAFYPQMQFCKNCIWMVFAKPSICRHQKEIL